MNTLKFGDFPKRLRLCEGKFTKSSKTPWSKRDSGKGEKYITCLSKVVNIVAGGETTECQEAFARGKRAKKFIAPVDDTPGPDLENLPRNLKTVYSRLQNRGPTHDAFRKALLQALHGVRGFEMLKSLSQWRLQIPPFGRA